MGSVVVGDQRPGDGLAGLVVVPDGSGHGQDALGDADGHAFEGAPAWASRSSWPLRVSLTDSISWRTVLSNGSPWRAASSLREGRSSVTPPRARSASACRP